MRLLLPVLLVLSLFLFPQGVPAADSPPSVIFILDASGSMWGQIDGTAKIVTARDVLGRLIDGLPPASEVGLVAYGHRREGDCEDVETLVPLGPLDAPSLKKTINGLNPKGKTPITFSAGQAIDLVKDRTEPVTIILISDGLETCDADPCQAVTVAKQSGVPFVMHVVGFDVGDGDVSQLECTAQAGQGLYFSATEAEELLAALEQAVEAPPGEAGTLSVGAVRNGERQDAMVWVYEPGTRDDVAAGRTYTGEATNPRLLYVPPGTYDVVVVPLGVDDNTPIRFDDLVVSDTGITERTAEFSTGVLAVGAMRNGERSDAMVKVYAAGTDTEVAVTRTYTGGASNPYPFTLPPGTYDVQVSSIEIRKAPPVVIEAVVVEPGGRVDHVADFSSGDLAVEVLCDGEKHDAMIKVLRAGTNEVAGGGRSYTGERTNPHVDVLPVGVYDVVVTPLVVSGVDPVRFDGVEVVAGERAERTAEFVTGYLKVGVRQGETLVDAMVNLTRDGVAIDGARTYSSESSNPKAFRLAPGTYDVVVKPIRLEGAEAQQFTLTVTAGGTVERMVEY